MAAERSRRLRTDDTLGDLVAGGFSVTLYIAIKVRILEDILGKIETLLSADSAFKDFRKDREKS